jgi:hypothetical protein
MRNLRGLFDVGKIKNDEAERASAAIGAVAAVFDSLWDQAWQAGGCRDAQWFKVQKFKTFKNL